MMTAFTPIQSKENAKHVLRAMNENARQGFCRPPATASSPPSSADHRDHLRALAQRVEVADAEVRIMGSKSELLRTLVAACGGKPGVAGVQSSVLKWRTRKDSNL